MKLEVRLREMMDRNNIKTNSELHRLTGIDRKTIKLMLDGKKNALYFSTIETLCEKLHCRFDELIKTVDN